MSDVIYVAMRKFCYSECDRVIYPTFEEYRQRITMGITKPVLYVPDHYVVHSHRTVLRTRLSFTNNNQHHMDISLDTTEPNKIVQSRVKPIGHSQK